MVTLLQKLVIYLDIIDLANKMNCKIVAADYSKLSDDLEFQIINDLEINNDY